MDLHRARGRDAARGGSDRYRDGEAVKPRTEKPNVHEMLGRARKSAYIVLAIEDRARGLSRDPLDLAGSLTDAEWIEVSVCAGQYPPSLKTKAAVIEMLEERARLAS